MEINEIEVSDDTYRQLKKLREDKKETLDMVIRKLIQFKMREDVKNWANNKETTDIIEKWWIVKDYTKKG